MGITHNSNKRIQYLFLCLVIWVLHSTSVLGQNDRISQKEINFQSRFLESKKQRLLGNYDKAEDGLKKLLDSELPVGSVHYELSLLYKELGEKEQALKSAKEAAAIDDQNEWFLLLVAELAEQTLNFDDALEAYQNLYKNYPNRHNYLKNIAYIHLLDNKPQKAIQTLNKLEKITYPAFDIAKQKHMIHERLGNMQKATDVLIDFLKYEPYNQEALRLIASFLVKEKKYKEATEYYEELLYLDPEDTSSSMALMKLKSKINPKNSSRKAFEDMILNPDISLDEKIKQLIPLLTELSNSKDERLAEQLNDFSMEMIKTHGEDAKIYALQGDIASSLDEHTTAIESYKKSLSLYDANYMVWEQLMYNLNRENDMENLLRYSEDAMDLFPNQASAYTYYAMAESKRGNFDNAHSAIKRARMISAKNKKLLAELSRTEANLFHYQGLNEQARQAFIKSLEYDPENLDLHLEYCNFLMNQKLLEEADFAARNILKIYPDHPSALINYGNILYARGKLKEALDEYEKAFKMDQGNTQLMERIKILKTEIQ